MGDLLEACPPVGDQLVAYWPGSDRLADCHFEDYRLEEYRLEDYRLEEYRLHRTII